MTRSWPVGCLCAARPQYGEVQEPAGVVQYVPRSFPRKVWDSSWSFEPTTPLKLNSTTSICGVLPPGSTSVRGSCQQPAMTARFRVVSATEPTAGNRGNASHSTLGDLLYADQAKARVSEDEWIRMVRAIAAADQSALHALYERTHRLVFTLTMRITRNRATAEELTIDVFHDVWRRASEYDAANGSVIGWIMNQARSRAIDRLRFEQRQKRVKPGKEEDPQYAPAGEGSERVLEARDRSRALRNALALLSADERQAI